MMSRRLSEKIPHITIPDEQGSQGLDDPPSQLFEMVEEGHLQSGRFPILQDPLRVRLTTFLWIDRILLAFHPKWK